MIKEIISNVFWVLVGLFIFFVLLLAAQDGINEREFLEEYCIEKGWDGVSREGPFTYRFYCYRYIDGFYERSSKIKKGLHNMEMNE